jgi:hypothetical protein
MTQPFEIRLTAFCIIVLTVAAVTGNQFYDNCDLDFRLSMLNVSSPHNLHPVVVFGPV